MTAVAAQLQASAREFLAAMDETIRLQETAAGLMDRMVEAVKSRNENALRTVIAEAESVAGPAASAAKAREVAAARLAHALGCRPEDVTLRRLVEGLPAGEAATLRTQSRRIEASLDNLRRRHLYANAFLGECSHLNRAMLLGLLPDTESLKTYGRRGRSTRGPRTGLLDARS
jgi:hypothetical protein